MRQIGQAEKHKVSVMFPVNLLKKVRMLASLREEPVSQTIVWLAEKGLREEFGGEVNLKAMDELAGSVPAGGDAQKDAEELYG